MTGQELKSRRKKNFLTQKELAKSIHCSQESISKWEQGINPIHPITDKYIEDVFKKIEKKIRSARIE